jgi:hypothetical protein
MVFPASRKPARRDDAWAGFRGGLDRDADFLTMTGKAIGGLPQSLLQMIGPQIEPALQYMEDGIGADPLLMGIA